METKEKVEEKPKRVIRRRESPRLRKAIANLAKGMTQKQALIKAGYSEKTAHKPADIFQTDKARETIDRFGFTDSDVHAAIKRNMNDKKITSRTIYEPDKTAEEYLQLFTNEHIPVISCRDVSDKDGKRKVVVDYFTNNHDAQLRALDSLLKIRGDYAPDKKEINIKGGILHLRAKLEKGEIAPDYLDYD